MYIEYIKVVMTNFLLHCLGSLLIHFLFQEYHDVIDNLKRIVNQPQYCCLNHFLFAVSILQDKISSHSSFLPQGVKVRIF